MNFAVFLKGVVDGGGDLHSRIEREDVFAISNPYRYTSFAIALNYMDQVTWGARRVRSLQCWAAQLNRTMQVVEPSMNATYFGAPVDNSTVGGALKFSTFFDINLWNRYGMEKVGYLPLVSWDDFFLYAPRKTIVVQLIYRDDKKCFEESFKKVRNCTVSSHEVKNYWSTTLRELSFSVIREVCIDFQRVGILSKDEFNQRIFGNISEDTPVSIVFNDWRGPLRGNHTQDNNCIIRIRDQECSPSGPTGLIHNVTMNALIPSPVVFYSAEVFSKKYLQDSQYLAIMIRWELMFTGFIYNGKSDPKVGDRCLKKILRFVHGVGLHDFFVAVDVGRYGSRFMRPNTYLYKHSYYQAARIRTEQLFSYLGSPLSLEQYDERFDEFNGSTTQPTYYIPQLQKVVASKAECLLLVGWGSFHENTLDLYKKFHKGRLCYKRIWNC